MSLKSFGSIGTGGAGSINFEDGVEDFQLPSEPERGAGEDDLYYLSKDASNETIVTSSEDESKDYGTIEVHVTPPNRPWEYAKVELKEDYGTVDSVLSEMTTSRDDVLWYKICYADGREDNVSFETLLTLRNGANALDIFNNSESEDVLASAKASITRHHRLNKASTMSSSAGKRTRTSSRNAAKLTSSRILIDSSDDASPAPKRRRPARVTLLSKDPVEILDDEDSSDNEGKTTHRRITRNVQPTRHSRRAKANQPLNYDDRLDANGNDLDESVEDGDESSDNFIVQSDIIGSRLPGTKRRGRPRKIGRRGNHKLYGSDSSSPHPRPEPTRVSGRSNKASGSMKERLEDEEVYADEINESRVPQAVSIRETFKSLPPGSSFRAIHNRQCDVCEGYGKASNRGASPLVHCQGCTTSIHKTCLGSRGTREHYVTKVGEDTFVLQCKRCVGVATKKDSTAPRLDVCGGCKKAGLGCAPFAPKMTTKQEEVLRMENGGEDPIIPVDADRIDNSEIVLFRCTSCHRGYHFEHLASLDRSADTGLSVEELREKRLEQYKSKWRCRDCIEAPVKVQGLVAWRPVDIEQYSPGQPGDTLAMEAKEYLLKWEGLSYFRCSWMPGGWVWGVTSPAMRKAFHKRENIGGKSLLKMTEIDAIPEEFLRMEIVLDVKYTSKVNTHTEEIDKARVKEVMEVLVKFQGLPYEEAVWERPPNHDQTERWEDFVLAYNEYVAGRYFKQPPAKMEDRLKSYRASNFEKNILSVTQPTSLTGGKLMGYQKEGMDWLLYNFYKSKNVVLADEMGLGKTIQVIAALAALINDKPKCWPFLIVVPNSTCPNWRREIKTWAPSLRVVAYYGLKSSRETIMKYELYPDGCSDMRAHVVVTSYEAPVDENSRAWFKKIKWAGMIVDEGQRLKNDKSLLYGALSALKVSFRVLLTGTPLQNNKKELFTLLQFLDPSIDAADLDEKYDELTNENIPELHDLIRPYFLRRTKAKVLGFLPPMAQVIIPVSMSVVQKKLYKSILAKSPELIRSIFIKDKSELSKERSSLNNIIMQLRKCLCHPFVYSKAIEERSVNSTVLHRNLVDASSKLQLLEIMLPKLQERGHRALIFSQFLDQLDIMEDFLDGLGLTFQRLDGNVGTLEKQKRIDAYNAPDSTDFAFLLSTRAGGVGINLATADTVIIMDPDFNPHQDIQALSRAHRIGQKKKVLVFQLMTKDSAEEKIIQIGRKKMALDHALIEAMDADDETGVDLASILKHGAQALFDDNDQNDINYDSASVDKLLDRSQVENTNSGEDNSAESAFSFARIWTNDKSILIDEVGEVDSGAASPNIGVWEKILKQREDDAAREEALKQKRFGRGRRERKNIDYQSNAGADDDLLASSPEKRRKNVLDSGASDTDFAARPESEVEDEEYDEHVDSRELEAIKDGRKSGGIAAGSPFNNKQVDDFHRAKFVRESPIDAHHPQPQRPVPKSHQAAQARHCHACQKAHAPGLCPLKRSGVENCGLCGMAHFGSIRSCPHLHSETQVRLMLDALRTSTESREYIQSAQTYLRGVLGNLVRAKRQPIQRVTLPRIGGDNVQNSPALAHL